MQLFTLLSTVFSALEKVALNATHMPTPKNAITKQYQKLFELENVGLTFDAESLKAVARKAIKRSTGARGLRAILETVMTDLMYDLPSRDDVREVIVTPECITEGSSPMIVTERPRQIREA